MITREKVLVHALPLKAHQSQSLNVKSVLFQVLLRFDSVIINSQRFIVPLYELFEYFY